MNYTFFETLGMSKVQVDIYSALYKLGSQPASVIAKFMWLERVRIYRNLISLSNLGVIRKWQRNWVQVFFVSDIHDLEKIIENKEKDLNFIKQNKDEAILSIKKLALQWIEIPKITIYDSSQWIWNVFEDILEVTKKTKIQTIKFFASNTLEERNEAWAKIGEYISEFLKSLKVMWVYIDQYIWVWNLLMERLEFYSWNHDLRNLPASNSSVNIFLIWSATYIIVYNKAPFWIKIENENLSNVFNFLMNRAKEAK